MTSIALSALRMTQEEDIGHTERSCVEIILSMYKINYHRFSKKSRIL